MCRNIKPLFNFDPPATNDEVHNAALQFVRKISGYAHPSQANEAAFNTAVDQIAAAAKHLMDGLVTTAHPHNREAQAAVAKAKALKRWG